jgi:hypothetical protein
MIESSALKKPIIKQRHASPLAMTPLDEHVGIQNINKKNNASSTEKSYSHD